MAVCKTTDAGFDVLFSSKGSALLPSDLQLLEAAVESSESIPFYREGDKFYPDYNENPGYSSQDRLAPVKQSASSGERGQETDEQPKSWMWTKTSGINC